MRSKDVTPAVCHRMDAGIHLLQRVLRLFNLPMEIALHDIPLYREPARLDAGTHDCPTKAPFCASTFA